MCEEREEALGHIVEEVGQKYNDDDDVTKKKFMRSVDIDAFDGEIVTAMTGAEVTS